MGTVYVCQPWTNHTRSIFLPLLVTAQPSAICPGASVLAIFFHTGMVLTSSTLKASTSTEPGVFEWCFSHKHSVRAAIAEESPEIPFWNTAPQRTRLTLCKRWCADFHIFFSPRFKHLLCKGKSVKKWSGKYHWKYQSQACEALLNPSYSTSNVQNEKCVENVWKTSLCQTYSKWKARTYM